MFRNTSFTEKFGKPNAVAWRFLSEKLVLPPKNFVEGIFLPYPGKRCTKSFFAEEWIDSRPESALWKKAKSLYWVGRFSKKHWVKTTKKVRKGHVWMAVFADFAIVARTYLWYITKSASFLVFWWLTKFEALWLPPFPSKSCQMGNIDPTICENVKCETSRLSFPSAYFVCGSNFVRQLYLHFVSFD